MYLDEVFEYDKLDSSQIGDFEGVIEYPNGMRVDVKGKVWPGGLTYLAQGGEVRVAAHSGEYTITIPPHVVDDGYWLH